MFFSTSPQMIRSTKKSAGYFVLCFSCGFPYFPQFGWLISFCSGLLSCSNQYCNWREHPHTCDAKEPLFCVHALFNQSDMPQSLNTTLHKWYCITWLVVWLPFFKFPYIGNNHPNWLIFFRGVQTTNQLHTWLMLLILYLIMSQASWREVRWIPGGFLSRTGARNR